MANEGFENTPHQNQEKMFLCDLVNFTRKNLNTFSKKMLSFPKLDTGRTEKNKQSKLQHIP
jgi:hypothetical protein